VLSEQTFTSKVDKVQSNMMTFSFPSAPEYMLCLQNGKFDHPDRMFNRFVYILSVTKLVLFSKEQKALKNIFLTK